MKFVLNDIADHYTIEFCQISQNELSIIIDSGDMSLAISIDPKEFTKVISYLQEES